MTRTAVPRVALLTRSARTGARLAAPLLLVTLACTAIFLALAVLPGDSATQELGLDATPGAVATLRAEQGLDRPVLVRLLDWAGGVLTGDLGVVSTTRSPVTEMLAGPLERSALLTLVVGAGVLVLGVGGGIVAGVTDRVAADRMISSAALAAICTPEFVLGTVMVSVFAASLGWFPAVSLVPPGGSVLDRPEVLVLPATTIVVVGSGALLRQVRAVVAHQRDLPHVESAVLAGMSPRYVVRVHVLPGATPAIAQAVAAVVPYLVGGAVVVERVFGYPGLGSALVTAVSNRDVDVVMACSLVLVSVSVLGFALADLARRRMS